jgi:hypothetical protein
MCDKEMAKSDEALYLVDDIDVERPHCERCFSKAVKAAEKASAVSTTADKPPRKPRADKGVARGTKVKARVQWVAIAENTTFIASGDTEKEAIAGAEVANDLPYGIIIVRWNGKVLKPTVKLA